MEITLNLTQEETNFILQVLGELPTKSGAFPLCVNIQKQIEDSLTNNTGE